MSAIEQIEDLGMLRVGATDAGMKHLARLCNLKTLEISSNAITASGLMQLVHLEHLKQVGLGYTKVNKEGVIEFRSARRALKLGNVKFDFT